MSAFRQIMTFIGLVFIASALSGCSTMYFHNDQDQLAAPPSDTIPSSELRFSATQHDGVVALIEDNSIILEKKCVEGKWQTIKTENTAVDVIIRLIGNPIYGTSTVSYNCKPIDKTLAQHLLKL